MSDESRDRLYHEDLDRLRAALTLAEATSGFTARLIEKDYYCSVLLHALLAAYESGLVFKGGTCLSKVHAEFFRLSEDLDFCLSLRVDASASERRTAIAPFKEHLAGVLHRHGCFRQADPLQGHNGSRQYNGRLAYRSIITGEDEFIKLEISLREPVLLPVQALPARTILRDPDSGEPAFPDVTVRVLSLHEAYAEKVRAALTRQEPAIRDFFDLDNAARQGRVDFGDPGVLDLVVKKLAIASDQPDVSDAKVTILQGQIEAHLRPVLRAKDYEGFDLQRVITLLKEVVTRCSRP
jgi:predicted nucleotidyltransferase component of viral defense system